MKRLNYIQEKIVAVEDGLRIIESWRLKGDKIAFTNGCFDILHKGHVVYLAKAASHADRLILALNTDDSVRRQGKCDDRPVNDQDARGIVVAGLGFVDMVLYFDEDTPFNLISAIRPDVLIKGGDYDAEETNPMEKDYIVGSDLVRKTGGKVVTIPFVDGFSTTETIQKLRKN